MNIRIADIARIATRLVPGERLSKASAGELAKAHVPIASRTRFPVPQDALLPEQWRKDLAADLGVIVFDGPQHPGFSGTGTSTAPARF